MYPFCFVALITFLCKQILRLLSRFFKLLNYLVCPYKLIALFKFCRFGKEAFDSIKLLWQMKLVSNLLTAFFILLSPNLSIAQSMRKAFHDHRKQQQQVDDLRRKGFAEHLAKQKQWEQDLEEARNKYLNIRKNEKKIQTQAQHDYHEYLRKQFLLADEYAESQREFLRLKRKEISDLPPEEEFDLISKRPRYFYKNRAEYGGKPNYKIVPSMGNTGREEFSTPPPPSDFYQDNDLAPPPPPPPIDSMDDFPPPPPPPPPDFDYTGEY